MRNAGSGWITWPERRTDYTATGGAGMWVYAFWLADYRRHEILGGLPRDLFIHCHGPEFTLTMPRPAHVTSPNHNTVYPDGRIRQPVEPLAPDAVERGNYLRSVLDAGAPVIAAVCLGSTATVYAHPDTGQFWYATLADLSRKGRKLIATLNDMLGPRPAELVTYMDTD